MSYTVTAEAHTITAREDGPDLDDLVQLIRFLRPITHVSVGQLNDADHVYVSWTQRPAEGQPNDARSTTVVEGQLPPEAFYVGHRGEVYDANGEPINRNR